MIVDTSALAAIVTGERDAPVLLAAMRDADSLQMTTPTALELSLVLGPDRLDAGTALLRQAGIQLVPFTAEHLVVAQAGHARFGRGAGSAAQLNFGDCFSYARAKATGQPLLSKGDDFTHADIEPAYLP